MAAITLKQDPYPLLLLNDPILCDDSSLLEKQDTKIALSVREDYFVFGSEPGSPEIQEAVQYFRSQGLNIITEENSMELADVIIITEADFAHSLKFRHKMLCYCIGLQIPCISLQAFRSCFSNSHCLIYPFNPQFPPIISQQRCLMRDIWCRYGMIEQIPLAEGNCDLLAEVALQEVSHRINRHMKVSGLPDKPSEILIFAYDILIPVVSCIGGIAFSLESVAAGRLLIHVGPLQIVILAATTTEEVFDDEERARAFAELLNSSSHGPCVRTVFLTNGLLWELYQYWPESKISNCKVQILRYPFSEEAENSCLGHFDLGPEAARKQGTAVADFFRLFWSFGITDFTYDLLNCIFEILVKLKYHYIMSYEYQETLGMDEEKLIGTLIGTVQKSSEFTLSGFLLLLELSPSFRSRWNQALRKQSVKLFISQNFPKFDEELVLKVVSLLSSTPVG